MKNLIKFIAAIILAAFCSSVVAQTVYKVGTEANYPPFNGLDANGKLVGFDIDIANALCNKMQAQCQFVTSDWDGMIPSLKSRKFDFIVSSMSITEERQHVVDFSDPYYHNKLQFVALKSVDFDTALSALKGKRIGAQRSTYSANWVEDNLPGQATIKLYDTSNNSYMDLAAGRLDAVLADVYAQWDFLQSQDGQRFELKGKPVFENDRIGIAVRKGSQDLLNKLNQALRDIKADGTYQKINAKYFPFSIE